LQADFFKEYFTFSPVNFRAPFFLYAISNVYDLNIYNERLSQILYVVIDQILSTVPVLQANRLFLLWGLLNIKPCLPKYQKEIDTRIQLLKEGIDIEHIINAELKNQDIF
jgi:hypothetical protein